MLRTFAKGTIDDIDIVLLRLIYRLKRGDRRVRILSAHNNWWATPEVSLLLPYQRSAKVFLSFFATRSEDNVLL